MLYIIILMIVIIAITNIITANNMDIDDIHEEIQANRLNFKIMLYIIYSPALAGKYIYKFIKSHWDSISLALSMLITLIVILSVLLLIFGFGYLANGGEL